MEKIPLLKKSSHSWVWVLSFESPITKNFILSHCSISWDYYPLFWTLSVFTIFWSLPFKKEKEELCGQFLWAFSHSLTCLSTPQPCFLLTQHPVQSSLVWFAHHIPKVAFAEVTSNFYNANPWTPVKHDHTWPLSRFHMVDCAIIFTASYHNIFFVIFVFICTFYKITISELLTLIHCLFLIK